MLTINTPVDVSSPVRGSPTAARRRLPRRRLVSAPLVSASRSPVLLEILLDLGLLRAGYAGEPRAKRSVSLAPSKTTAWDPTDFYRLLSPKIQESLQLIGGSHQDVKERRVVVVYDGGLHCQKSWKEAVERILIQDIGVPACTFKPCLQLIPLAFPPRTHNRLQNDKMLVVHVGPSQAHCLAYASGHSLDFTYQVCASSCSESISFRDLEALKLTDMDHNPATGEPGLIHTVIRCIEACPREIRPAIVRNITVAGSIADPRQFGLKLVHGIKRFMQHPRTLFRKEDLDKVEGTKSGGTVSYDIVGFPTRSEDLDCLESSVSLVLLDGVRSDTVSWIGSSVWVFNLHKRDPDSTHFGWIEGEVS